MASFQSSQYLGYVKSRALMLATISCTTAFSCNSSIRSSPIFATVTRYQNSPMQNLENATNISKPQTQPCGGSFQSEASKQNTTVLGSWGRPELPPFGFPQRMRLGTMCRKMSGSTSTIPTGHDGKPVRLMVRTHAPPGSDSSVSNRDVLTDADTATRLTSVAIPRSRQPRVPRRDGQDHTPRR